jgi:heme/copper-type cytochrome/quinol oxidase subunit 2
LYNPNVPTRKRVTSAIWALAINAILWIIVPYYIGTLLVGKVPDTPLTIPAFVYEFGVLFIILDVGAAYFQGKAISVPFISAAAVFTAVYLWLVTNGGILSLTAAGLNLGFDFRLLLYIFILPSIWAAVRTPISYLLWRRSARAQAPMAPSA